MRIASPGPGNGCLHIRLSGSQRESQSFLTSSLWRSFSGSITFHWSLSSLTSCVSLW